MTTMAITAKVLAALVSTLTTAHQFSTGNWLAMTFWMISPNSRVSEERRPKLCTTVTLASASWAVPARVNCHCSARRCPASVRRITNMVRAQNSTTSTISEIARRQLRKSVSGSSTSVAT